MAVSEQRLKAYFQKYGRTLTYERGGVITTFRAFLQPLRFKNKMYLSDHLTEIGYDTLRKFVLICPVDIEITAVDGINVVLRAGDDSFCVDHCEKVFAGDRPLYYWAVVHQNNDWRTAP